MHILQAYGAHKQLVKTTFFNCRYINFGEQVISYIDIVSHTKTITIIVIAHTHEENKYDGDQEMQGNEKYYPISSTDPA